MPGRKSMRRIAEVYRYHFENKLSQTQIAAALRLGRATVWDYLRRFSELGLSWEEAKRLPEPELERRLFARSDECAPRRPLPNWAEVHGELQTHRSLTLRLLWEEYSRQHEQCYSYQRFCAFYAEWARRHKVYQRQHHVAGEKLFVDYSGKRLAVRDPLTGQDEPAELLVMAWGASQFIYAEAQPSQKLVCWVTGHVRAYQYFGCAPWVEVDDNLKSAVTKACRYDPELNRTFAEMAEYYGVAVVPARPAKPRDKPKVENAVLIAQRWIIAALRHRVFYSFAELNQAILELLDGINNRPMRLSGKSRRELFEELDKPNARALPPTPFEYREWERGTLGFDSHIMVQEHFYSAPYTLCGKTLAARVTATAVELLDGQERVALHLRSRVRFGYTTVAEHLPPCHQQHLAWTPGRLLQWAERTGPNACRLVKAIIDSKPFPQQGFRPAVGILRLGKTYGAARLEAVAALALQHGTTRVAAVADMLKRELDKRSTTPEPVRTVSNPTHARGSRYYATVTAEATDGSTPTSERN